MPLYSYRKTPTTPLAQAKIKKKHLGDNAPITLGDVFNALYTRFHNLMSTSRVASILFPFVLVSLGFLIIFNQVFDTFVQTIALYVNGEGDSSIALVREDYVELQQRYSNPGARYFEQLKDRAEQERLLFTDKKSSDYQGQFKLSIPSLGLNDLKVEANVDSGVEEVYDAKLTNGLAHFQGTNLPFTDSNTYNVVVYGHSSAGDYYERTKDTAAAFSKLNEIKYGSEILVNFEGKEYKYKFIKGKIVDANDLSILEGTSGQKQLTLFTCYPNGNNSKRFVATARLTS